MGLISLSQMNRSGQYDFWEDGWDSKYLYKHLLFNSLIFKDIFYELLNFFFFKYIFYTKFSTVGYNNLFKLTLKITPLIYFSKVWVLKYQNWFILVIYYYNLSNYFKRRNKNLQRIFSYRGILKSQKNYNHVF